MRKMRMEIYKQMKRQNPVTKRKNKFTSDDKQVQETNNTDESNDDSDEGSEEGGSVLNEDKGD